VYDLNHYFGFDPIPKPKTRNGKYFWAETTFQRQTSSCIVWDIFSIMKGPLKPNLLPNIKGFILFWSLNKKPSKSRKTWKKYNFFGKNKKIIWKNIFRLKYRNWTIVSVPNTGFWSHTKPRLPLVTQPMLQCRPNRTELRSMDSYIQILCRFRKCKRKVPPPSLLNNEKSPFTPPKAGPSEGLKIRGCQYYLVGIICPPWLR
jgi:hypothetical protein